MAFAFFAGIVTGYFLFYAFAPRNDFHIEASQPLNPQVVDNNPYLEDSVAQCNQTLRSTTDSLQECTNKLLRAIDDKEDCDARSNSIRDDADHWQKMYQESKCEKSSDEGGYYLY